MNFLGPLMEGKKKNPNTPVLTVLMKLNFTLLE